MFFFQELTRLKQAEGEKKVEMTRLRKESVTTSDTISKAQVRLDFYNRKLLVINWLKANNRKSMRKRSTD